MENKNLKYLVNSKNQQFQDEYPRMELKRKQTYNHFWPPLTNSEVGWGEYSAPKQVTWTSYTNDIEMSECIDLSMQLDYKLLWHDRIFVVRGNSIKKGNSEISEFTKVDALSQFVETSDLPLILIQIGHFFLINTPFDLRDRSVSKDLKIWLSSKLLNCVIDENASRLRAHMREECSEFLASFTQPMNLRGHIDSSMRDEMADMLFYHPSFRPACNDSAVLQNLIKNSVGGDRRLFTESKGLTNEVKLVVIESKLSVGWPIVLHVIKDCIDKLKSRDPESNYQVDVVGEHNIMLKLTSIKDGLVLSTVNITRHGSEIIEVKSESYHFVGNRKLNKYDFFTTGYDFDNLNGISEGEA